MTFKPTARRLSEVWKESDLPAPPKCPKNPNKKEGQEHWIADPNKNNEEHHCLFCHKTLKQLAAEVLKR